MKKSLAVSVISILAIAVIGLGIMYFSSNASQKQQIDTLNADIANKASQIDTLNADIARKDGQIEALNADVSEKTGRIETLTADAADQAGRIEEMNATISEQGKKISELSATVDEQKKKLDYGQMPEEELLAAAGEITAPLEKMGYTVLVRNYNRLDRNNGAGDSVENAFLNDLAKGLEDRWTITDKQQDQSTMTDLQSIDYFSSLVMCELDYIGKYTDLEFSDKNLEAYAHEYISALQKQYTGITEYYGTDDAQYKQYWKNGYDSRTHMLYWISRKYGIPVDSKYKEHLSEMVEKGARVEQCESIEHTMNQQLTALELGVMSSNSNSVKTRPFVLKNDTAVNLKSLSVLIVLYDAENEQVGKEYLYVGSDIPSGTEIEADQHIISTRFDHFEFEYEYNISGTISGETYYELRSAKAVPTEQFGWNGIVLKDGKPAPGQPVFVIEDLTAVWDYKSSRNNALYVPTLRFAVKNIGDTESDGVRVDVVFTNTDQNEVWSEETDYVVGMTDAELKPGYSKKTVVYSSEGSDPDSDSLPSITADIFINGVPAGTVDIAGKASTDDGQ